MDWDLFLMVVFGAAILSQLAGIVAGLAEMRRDEKYTHAYAAVSAIFLVILVLMYFWT